MIVGTRGSKLATTQTKTVVKALEEITGEEIETKIIKTTGDKIKNSQLYNIDAKGIFTKEQPSLMEVLILPYIVLRIYLVN